MYTLAAFTSIVAAVAAAPAPLVERTVTKGTYKSYHGDGSVGAGWPATSAWTTFDNMWSSNLSMIKNSCGQFNQPNTSDNEATEMKAAINSVASSTKVDARFILAVILQESKGCVRVWSTTSPGAAVHNPGLMQDHNGSHNCNAGSATAAGKVQNPCPQAEIQGMIQDGAGGTSSGDGLKQTLAQSKKSDAQKVYEAARIYNAGSLSGSDLGAPGATPSYASDIANRLQGVVFDNSPYA